MRGRFALVFGERVLSTSPFTLYPNPAQGVVRVSAPVGAEPLEVLDATGRVIRSLAVTGAETQLALPAGMYMVRIGGTTQRLVVE